MRLFASFVALLFWGTLEMSAQEYRLVVTDLEGVQLDGVLLTVEDDPVIIIDKTWSATRPDYPDSLLVRLWSIRYEAFEGWIYPGKTTTVALTPSVITLDAVDVSDRMGIGQLPIDSRNRDELAGEDLKRRGANSMAEALDAIPGVQAVNTGVGISKPMIRGFTGTRVQVVNGGVRQEGQQWGMDHGLEIDQLDVDRVEVIKGAGALRFGSNAVSGVVRILPNITPDIGIHGQFQAIGKSNNNLIGQSTLLSYRTESGHFVEGRYSLQNFGDYRVPASSFRYNGYELPLVDGILKNTAGTEQNGRLTYGYRGKGVAFTLTGSRFHQQIGLFPGAIAIPRAYDLSNLGSTRDIELPYQQTTHDKLAAEVYFYRGRWTHEINVGYQHNQRGEFSQPHAHGLTYIDSTDTKGIGLNLQTGEGNYFLSYLGRRWSWSIGAAGQFQHHERSGWEFLLPSYTRSEWGLFSILEWRVNQWEFEAGIRSDRSKIAYTGYAQPWYNQPDSLVARVYDGSQVRNGTAGSLSALYRTDDWALQMSYSRNLRLPNAAELTSNGVHHGTFRHEVGADSMDVERGHQMELTVYYNKSSFSAKVSGYYYYFENFIYLRPSGVFSPLPDAGQLYVYSQDPVWHSGFEAQIAYSFSPSWYIQAAAEGVWNRNIRTGLGLPFTPPVQFSLSPQYERNRFDIGVEAVYVMAQNRVDRNERITPGYFLLHAYAGKSWRWGEQAFSVRLRIQNLTNQDYLRHISRYRILNLPEQGLNAILQLQYRF